MSLIRIFFECDMTHSVCTPHVMMSISVECDMAHSLGHVMSQGDMTHPYGLIRICFECDMTHSLCIPYGLIPICVEYDMIDYFLGTAFCVICHVAAVCCSVLQ